MKHDDIRVIIQSVEAQGAIVTMTKSGHWLVRNPATGRSIHLAATTRSFRNTLNMITRLRRIGFTLERRGSARTPLRESVPGRSR